MISRNRKYYLELDCRERDDYDKAIYNYASDTISEADQDFIHNTQSSEIADAYWDQDKYFQNVDDIEEAEARYKTQFIEAVTDYRAEPCPGQ